MILHLQAVRVGEAYAKDHGLIGAISEALPQPLLLSNWKIIVSHNDNYYVALVNLMDTQSFFSPNLPKGALTTIATSYQPASRAVWKPYLRFAALPSQETVAHEAWNQAALSDFRRFARYPTLDQVEINESGVCVWFVDLRFTLPGLVPSFRYGLCRSGILDQWKLEQKHGAFFID
jgi:inner membrane protein